MERPRRRDPQSKELMVGMCARWKEHLGKGTDKAEEKVKMKWLAGYSVCSRMLSWRFRGLNPRQLAIVHFKQGNDLKNADD